MQNIRKRKMRFSAGTSSLSQAVRLVRAVTVTPSIRACEPDWCSGWLEKGARATLFEWAPNHEGRALTDSAGQQLIPERLIIPRGVWIEGQYEPLTAQASFEKASTSLTAAK